MHILFFFFKQSKILYRKDFDNSSVLINIYNMYVCIYLIIFYKVLSYSILFWFGIQPTQKNKIEITIIL